MPNAASSSVASRTHGTFARSRSSSSPSRVRLLVEQRLELRRQHGETQVGDAERDQLVGARREVDLQARVERQHVEEPREAALVRDDLAQPLARVGHQHPAALEVDREQRRHDIRPLPRQHPHERRLVLQRGPFALNHTGPSAVGTRITVDHARTCGCSISPVGVTCERIHACASASQPGSVQPGHRDDPRRWGRRRAPAAPASS